jgi:hypothetical protein
MQPSLMTMSLLVLQLAEQPEYVMVLLRMGNMICRRGIRSDT